MSLTKRLLFEDLEDEDVIEELENDEAEPPSPLSEAEIEQKYDSGQARILIQRNDFLVPNLLQMIKEKEVLDLAPAYQRRARWNVTKKSRLIESLLMNVPIPPVFLYERDLAKYEVMDGQQRLGAVRDFLDNKFQLRGLQKWPELNGRRYGDLPGRIQAGLMRRGISAVIILTESGQDPSKGMELRKYVFERLNTGGERLNAQEIRNCIYASPFNDMLVRVARSSLFTRAWGIPAAEPGEPHKTSRELAANRLYSTMSDCEIVLRYFALGGSADFKGGVRKTLDRYMADKAAATSEECVALEGKYLEVLQVGLDVFQDGLFRLPDSKGELAGRRSVPLSDAIMLAIRDLTADAPKLRDRATAVRKAVQEELGKADVHEAVVGRGNTREAIEKRLKLVREMMARPLS